MMQSVTAWEEQLTPELTESYTDRAKGACNEIGTTCQKNKGVGGETWREQACGNSE